MRYIGLLRENSIFSLLVSWIASRIAPQWHSKWLRNSIELPLSLPPELTIKLADTQEEVEEAFEISFDFCRSHGWQDPVPHNLIATKYHALPTTHTVIAKWNDEVVGTLTLVLDNPFLLPCESSGALRFVRQDHTRTVAEAFAFAVRPGFANKVTWPLIKYFVELARRVHNVDLLVISLPLNSSLELPLQSLLFFKHQCHHIYDFYPLHNKLAVEVYSVELDNFHLHLAKHYWQKTAEKDLYSFIYRTPTSRFSFPDIGAEVSETAMPPHLLNYFFGERTKVFESLSEYEKFCLHSIYKKKPYKNVLPEYNPKMIASSDLKNGKAAPSSIKQTKEVIPFGREIRMNVKETITIRTDQELIRGEVFDISLNGMRINCPAELQIGATYFIEMNAAETEESKPIAFQVVWAQKGNHCYGLRELSKSSEWRRLVKLHLDKVA